jgi:hypothetical protein
MVHRGFVLVHGILRVTLVMKAGVSNRLWPLGELIERTTN